MVQANSVANPLYDNLGISKIMIGIIIAILVGAVIIKGIKRIAKVASMIVPFMTVFYLLGSLIVLFIYRDRLLDSFLLIFQSAFGFKEIGGGVLGYSVSRAMQFGIARGIFSNESGLGSAAIAHAPAKTKEPVREGFVAMLGPFIDTIVICSLTGLVIISSGIYGNGMTGASLTAAAFESVLPNLGKYIVSIGIIFFAFSTIIAWSYYGETGVKYLFPNSKNKMVNIYRWVYVLVIPIGAIFNLETIWAIADIANALMAFPNLIALLFLSGVVSIKLKDYKNRYKFMKPYK
jgi:AGCS family alanine or glycine:cation symporter